MTIDELLTVLGHTASGCSMKIQGEMPLTVLKSNQSSRILITTMTKCSNFQPVPVDFHLCRMVDVPFEGLPLIVFVEANGDILESKIFTRSGDLQANIYLILSFVFIESHIAADNAKRQFGLI